MAHLCSSSIPAVLLALAVSSPAAGIAAEVVVPAVSDAAAAPPSGVGDRLRVVVWGESPAVGPFVSRLRGQTVDLPVDMFTVDGNAPAVSLESQVEAAAQIARVHAARVVVWRGENQIVILLAEPSHARLLVREIADGSAAADSDGPGGARRSATLEAAALIVRSALMAVLDGGTFGVPHPVTPERSGDGEGDRKRETARTPLMPPTDDPPAALSAFGLVDARVTFDRLTGDAAQALGIHLGVGWGGWNTGVLAMRSRDRDGGSDTVQPFWRQNVQVFVGRHFNVGQRARLAAEAEGGVGYVDFYRTGGSRHLSRLVMGLEVRGEVDVIAQRRFRLPLWLGFGFDCMPHPLTITMPNEQGAEIPVWRTPLLQPRIMLGTGLSFR